MEKRYFRQLILNEIGPDGQAKLAQSAVLVVGAGGLGSPALTYLAAAGVGCLGILDSDVVDASNLNRQFLHGSADIGHAKVQSARDRLVHLNEDIDIHTHEVHLSDDNAISLLGGYNLVIGAVDSFATRFVMNRACVTLGLPYIDGGVKGFGGWVMFVQSPQTPCLNCIFPQKKAKKEPIGVLGTTAGVIGTIEANIALLHLLGLTNPLESKLLMYDGMRMNMNSIDIAHDERCAVCGSTS